MEVEAAGDAGTGGFVSSPLAQVLTSGGIGVWNWDVATGVVSWGVPGIDGVVSTELVFESLDLFVGLAREDERDDLANVLRAVEAGSGSLTHSFHLEGDDRRVVRIDAQLFATGTSSHVIGISRSDLEADAALTALFNERDRVARALETALLPPELPLVPGLTINAAYRSSEGASTGDFYDLFPVGGGDWALSIGDVGGHGPAAAAITTSIRYSIRATALLKRKPERVLRAANDAHQAAARDDRYTTCHFVRFRRKEDGIDVRVATAGHPPLVIKRANGGVELLSGEGPMLGLMPKPMFAEARVRLRLGDVLVAYTDGVTEARRGDEFFGEGGVENFLRTWAGPVAGFAEALHQAATEFNDGVIRDDMATVVLQVEDMPTPSPSARAPGPS